MAKNIANTSTAIQIDSSGQFTETPRMFASDKPETRQVPQDVSQGFTALVQIATNVLINSDIAYRENRRLSEQMVRDPIIMGPMTERMLSVAQLEWEIVSAWEEEPDEESPEAIEAKRIGTRLQAIIKRMPYLQDFFRSLLWADFRGTGASQINYQFDEREQYYYPAKHRPHNGDKILYDRWGTPRLQTRDFQNSGRELTPQEQDEFIIHRYDPEDGSFYQGAEAAYVFKGKGLRDYCWPFWWLKHNALSFWLNFLERFGGGMAIGKYPKGNLQAKQAIEATLKNMINNPYVSLPVPDGITEKDVFGIERTVVSGVGANADVFKSFCEDYCGKHIRMMIVGQEQAHQTTGDGMGSKRAEELGDLRRMYRDYSAECLCDTLSDQLLTRLVRWNFGALPVRFRFQFVLEKKDYEQEKNKLEAAQAAQLPIDKRVAYKILDLPEPKTTDTVFGVVNDPLFNGQDLLGHAPADKPLFDGGGEDKPLFGGNGDGAGGLDRPLFGADDKARTLFRMALANR